MSPAKKENRHKLTLEWPQTKLWVYEKLLEIVKKKQEMGFESTLPLEVSRIVESYLTGVTLGKKLDSELLREFRAEVLGNAEPDFDEDAFNNSVD